MKSPSPIVVSLNRKFSPGDEKAISTLIVKWLVYDVKVNQHRQNTQIAFFHSAAAKPDLVKELNELFPGEPLTGM